MNANVLVLNGPNLNKLGQREPIYGTTTLDELVARLTELGQQLGVEVNARQSNHEGVLIDWVQEAMGTADAIILNPAGFTNTSIALRDAFSMLTVPLIECHITNIYARESWRLGSHFSAIASAVIIGAGVHGYELALRHAALLLAEPERI